MYTVLIYSIEVIECSGPACSSFACALNPCHGSVPKAKPHVSPSPSPSSFNSVSRKRPSLNARIPDTFRSRRHRKLFLTPAEQAGRPILSVRFPRSSGTGRRVSYDREQYRPLYAVIGARPMNAVTDGATRVVSNPETEGWSRADNFRVARDPGTIAKEPGGSHLRLLDISGSASSGTSSLEVAACEIFCQQPTAAQWPLIPQPEGSCRILICYRIVVRSVQLERTERFDTTR